MDYQLIEATLNSVRYPRTETIMEDLRVRTQITSLRDKLLPYALPLHIIAEWSQPECLMNDSPPIPVPPVPLSTITIDFTKLVDQSIDITIGSTNPNVSSNCPPNSDIIINLGINPSLSEEEPHPMRELVSTTDNSFSISPTINLRSYRWLLGQRSPVFAVMLNTNNELSGFQEAISDIIHIPPDPDMIIDTETHNNHDTIILQYHKDIMIRLLHYLITDTLHPSLTPQLCMNLFIIAYRYSLSRLALLLEGYLITYIDDDNVCGLYQFVDNLTNLFNEPLELHDTIVPTGKQDNQLQEFPNIDVATTQIGRIQIDLLPRFQPAITSLNTIGMGRSLRSGCISYLLKEYSHRIKLLDSSSSSSTSSSGLSGLAYDFYALPDHLQAEIIQLWETQNHVYK